MAPVHGDFTVRVKVFEIYFVLSFFNFAYIVIVNGEFVFTFKEALKLSEKVFKRESPEGLSVKKGEIVAVTILFNESITINEYVM